MKYADITEKIIACAYKVHNELGYGFLENVYQNALMIELDNIFLSASKEVPVRVSYKGQTVGNYVVDIVVEDKVLLEIKSVASLHPAHEAQISNYLKATGIEVGLLINFGRSVEIKRRVF